MEAGRYIEAPRAVRVSVAQQLGITEGAMNLAMSYKRLEGKSAKARELVLKHENSQIYRYLPECETIHDVDGRMTQYFANDIVLIADKAKSTVELWRKEELLAIYHNVTLSMLDGIQRYASALQ